MKFCYEITGGDFSAGGSASSQVKKTLKQFNIAPQVLRRIAVALYEAEMNVVAHAWRGSMCVNINVDHLCVVIEDEGPGIEDIERAMQEGFSTATEEVRQMGFGAGMGLPNIRKNSDEMELTSRPGIGTRLALTIRF
jgi:anti-sigma regulatory factor (Ser/Thr protein kinase)